MSFTKRRLSLDQIADIRDRYKTGGVTMRELGSQYGCSHAIIQGIVEFKIYNNTKYHGIRDEVHEYLSNNHYITPERGLIDAMLTQAREDIIRRPKTEDSDDAIEWVLGAYDEWGFSFKDVVEYLNLNVNATREAILKRAAPDQVQMIKERLTDDINRT